MFVRKLQAPTTQQTFHLTYRFLLKDIRWNGIVEIDYYDESIYEMLTLSKIVLIQHSSGAIPP